MATLSSISLVHKPADGRAAQNEDNTVIYTLFLLLSVCVLAAAVHSEQSPRGGTPIARVFFLIFPRWFDCIHQACAS